MNSENEAQNPNKSPISDDSDSESDIEEESQLGTLKSKLLLNPYDYDAHVQLIKLLRKMGEIEKLKEAREAMSAMFPLTPAMWQQWALDEASLHSGPEALAAIEKLYEQGVHDYVSVPLWCDYLNYIQECDPSVRGCSIDGISKARHLFERALTAAGLHVAEGNKIWDAYREFERAILLTIDETDLKAKESQIQRIQNIFHRQLSIPLLDLRSTLLAYKAWEVEQGNVLDAESSDVDGVSPNVASAYQKALEMYSARVQHEEQVSRSDASDVEKFQNFMNYLKFEKSVGDPTRVQVLYERAITEFPVSTDLWLDYTQYLDRTLKVGNVIRDVYARATKSCPWVGELWVRYLLSLERGRAPEKMISHVYEKSLTCTFSTFEEYLELFLTRVDGLRRRILSGFEAEDVLDYSLIRGTFQYASDYLSPHIKNSEGLLRLHAYWARLENNLGKDLVAARGVWERLLKISGTMLEAWQGYIAMEIELGHVNEARAIYKKCYSKRFAGTGSEEICHSWLRFEKEYGTLEDFDHAVQKVTPRLEELQLYRRQQESVASTSITDQREKPIKKSVREKRKGDLNTADEQSPAKRQKKIAQTQNMGYEKEKDQVQNPAFMKEAEKVKSNAEGADDTHGKQMDSQTGKMKVYTDQCTAFISNLNFKTNEGDLRRFFSDVGGLVSIRILRDKFTGKSRGLAYVDFSNDEYLNEAIAKNKQTLLGKKLSITRSDPKRSKKNNQVVSKDHAQTGNQSGSNGGSKTGQSVETSKESQAPRNPPSTAHKRAESVELKRKNTFAVPRNVRPLGQPANLSKPLEEDGKSKTNDEFRKMFIKG
ncbi:hypothetical protein K2173_022269 [Erythroxylum novogranatense]|uniref:RRM domain-containing protein n=1 Tax=Erythroxylum novogranatense TaxID=1862640 RepID=A0AAV8SUH8_9ROSI|nr:hypothetical protein K2173_022269 [Erythroxylum novogranatense]